MNEKVGGGGGEDFLDSHWANLAITGTSVDDGARKLNLAELEIGHRKSCLVLSVCFPVVN